MQKLVEHVHGAAVADDLHWDVLKREVCAGTATLEDARVLLSELVDGYHSASELLSECARTSSASMAREVEEGLLRLGILHCLAHVLLMGALPTSKWSFVAEDLLLLAMFCSDLATVDDAQSAVVYCSLVAQIAEVSTPVMMQQRWPLTSECHSLREELLALREGLLKRLVPRVVLPHAHLRQWAALDGLMRIYAADAHALTSMKMTSSDNTRTQQLREDLDHLVRGLLQPLHLALDGLVAQAKHQHRMGAAATRQRMMSHNREEDGPLCGISPLFMSTLLTRVEELVWDVQDTLSRDGSNAIIASIPQLIITEVLKVLQQVVSVQQQMQNEVLLGSTSNDASTMAMSGHADIFKSLSVQRGLQRFLSVLLHVSGDLSSTTTATTTPLVSEALLHGITAALGPYGGAVLVRSPLAMCSTYTTHEMQSAVESWSTEAHADASRHRSCAMLLVPPASLAGGGGEAGVGGGAQYGDGEEDGVELLGGRDGIHISGVGVVSSTTLVEMVIESLTKLNVDAAERIMELHQHGLEEMQRAAAKRAQREEVERMRVVERQGVEAIDASRLLEHVKDSAAFRAMGVQTLRRVSARAKLQRAAFSSALCAFANIKDETEATLRHMHGLLARALVQQSPSMMDAALDELFLGLERELKEEAEALAAAKISATTTTPVKSSILEKTSSYYQLLLQVLFTFHASQAPIREHSGADALLSLTLAGVHGMAADGGAMDEDGSNNTNNFGGFDGLRGHGASGATLRFNGGCVLNVESPLAFLQEDDPAVASYQSGRKRARAAAHTTTHGGDDDGANDGDDGTFFFKNDAVAAPCTYSHILCRALELLDTHHLHSRLLDLLLQAPVLPRAVWHHLLRHFCLSTQRQRCQLGLLLLTHLCVRRVVYRSCSLNLLLHLSLSTNDLARRLAIQQIGFLLAATTRRGAKVVDAEMEQLLCRYANRQRETLRRLRFDPQPTNTSAGGGEGGAEVELDDAAATAAMQEAEKKATTALNRHAGLYLLLCMRHPAQLFPELLEEYRECIRHDNYFMAQALLTSTDVRRLVPSLMQADRRGFLSVVVPCLRRYALDAAPMVQHILSHLAQSVRDVSATEPEEAQTIANILRGSAKVMYEMSSIPSSSTVVIHDIRFMAPLLGLVSTTELKEVYLPAFLYFVQAQLIYQRQYQQASLHSLSAQERGYLLSTEELTELITQVTREVIVRSPVPPDAGVARGLSRVEFFVYLHTAPHDRQLIERGGAPITAVTIREIIRVCVGLSRSFDARTVERLYGPEELQRVMKRLVQLPPPLPSQLMITVLLAASLYGQGYNNPFIRFVRQEILVPLERAAVWEVDRDLWQGVLRLVELYYPDCSGFLINLPDSVLTQALRDRPQLLQSFREEHGNNASFGHILATL